MHQGYWALLIIAVFLLLMFIANYMYMRLNFASEISRKVLHVGGGVITFIMPAVFTSHVWVLLLCGLCMVLLIITYLQKKFGAVHKTKRPSIGSLLFPIPVYFCFLLYEKTGSGLLFYIPIAILTFADTAAEISGTTLGRSSKKIIHNKTWAGSLAFAVTAFTAASVCCFLKMNMLPANIILVCFVIAIATTIAEAVTDNGWDNLTIPFTAAALLFFV